jgi:hypothetical protein
MFCALQADDVRGRIYIDEMVRGERGAIGSPIFAGLQSRYPGRSANTNPERRFERYQGTAGVADTSREAALHSSPSDARSLPESKRKSWSGRRAHRYF